MHLFCKDIDTKPWRAPVCCHWPLSMGCVVHLRDVTLRDAGNGMLWNRNHRVMRSENFLISKWLLKEVDPEDWCWTENITKTRNSWYLTIYSLLFLMFLPGHRPNSSYLCTLYVLFRCGLRCSCLCCFSKLPSSALLFLILDLRFVSSNVNNWVLFECQLQERNCAFPPA